MEWSSPCLVRCILRSNCNLMSWNEVVRIWNSNSDLFLCKYHASVVSEVWIQTCSYLKFRFRLVSVQIPCFCCLHLCLTGVVPSGEQSCAGIDVGVCLHFIYRVKMSEMNHPWQEVQGEQVCNEKKAGCFGPLIGASVILIRIWSDDGLLYPY
jgi:hypothetical protein